jgi:pimeloyl-ACP methyl ester carboxylesterase
MKTASIKIAGNTLTYDQFGSGVPLLMLHGAFQTRRLWREIGPSLAQTHTVVAPDLRGLGDSGLGDGRLDFKTVAAELAAFMQTLGHERYAVVGHDLGGGIGYALAAARPKHVTQLAFLDMLLPGFGFEEACAPRPNGQFLWFAALNSVPGVIEGLLVGREHAYLEAVLRGGFTANKSAITDADLAAYAAAYSQPGALAALGGYFRAMWANADDNRVSAAQKLDLPSIALGGEYSVGEGAAQSLRAAVKHVQSRIVPGSGHWLPEENTSFVFQELSAFLNR